jgi:hypothetical protein
VQLDFPTATVGVSGQERVRPVPERKNDLVYPMPRQVFDDSLYDRPSGNWQHLLGSGKCERPQPCALSSDQHYRLHDCARPARAANLRQANRKGHRQANVILSRYPTALALAAVDG